MPPRLIALLCVRAALGATPLYRDPTASIAERADDLLARMTTDEKIAQTWAPYGSFDGAAAIGARFNGTGVGQLSYLAAGAGDPSTMAAARNAVQRAILDGGSGMKLRPPSLSQVQRAILDGSRLGIPASFSQEALHSAGTGATVFPESVTLGSSARLQPSTSRMRNEASPPRDGKLASLGLADARSFCRQRKLPMDGGNSSSMLRLTSSSVSVARYPSVGGRVVRRLDDASRRVRAGSVPMSDGRSTSWLVWTQRVRSARSVQMLSGRRAS